MINFCLFWFIVENRNRNNFSFSFSDIIYSGRSFYVLLIEEVVSFFSDVFNRVLFFEGFLVVVFEIFGKGFRIILKFGGSVSYINGIKNLFYIEGIGFYVY